MKLYIMRHGEAEWGMQMDPTRELTETGKRQAKMMGKWLSRQDEHPQVVIESNFKRSIQTAKRVADKLDVRRIRSGFLDPENSPENAWSEIKRLAQAQEAERVLIVSHGPLVEKLFCMLIAAPLPNQIHFAHAAIAHFNTTSSPTLQEAKAKAKGLGSGAKYTYEDQEVKRLILGEGGQSGINCEYCQEAADRGWIDMDDVFEGPDGDVDDVPLHPNCDCTVEQKTKRVRVYESGLRVIESDEAPDRAILHWLVTPNVVARDEDEMNDIVSESKAVTEASLALAEACVLSLPA